MKQWIKYFLAVLLYYSGLLSVLIRRRLASRRTPVILTYHCFLPKDDPRRQRLQPGMCVSPQIFDRQLTFLKRRFRISPLVELIDRLKAGGPTEPDAFAITIDDGWRDNYLFALPVLKKYRVPATIFLTTDFIGTGKVYWFMVVHWLLAEGKFTPEKIRSMFDDMRRTGTIPSDIREIDQSRLIADSGNADRFIETLKPFRLSSIQTVIGAMIKESGLSMDYWIEQKYMLSWEEVREMAASGISFGSHGCSHQIMTLLSGDDVKYEAVRSKEIIEQQLKQPVRLLAYPNGNQNETVREAVKQAGYVAAVTTHGGQAGSRGVDLFALPRIGVHDGVAVNPAGQFSTALFALHLARNL